MVREAPVLLLEEARVVAFDRIAVGVVLPVLRDFVDEEQGQHLDSEGAQALLLVQMFLDGAADHLALNGQGINVTPRLARAQVLLSARHPKLQELIPFGNTDLTDAALAVDGTAGRLLQVVAVVHGDLAPLYTSGCLDIQLHPGADAAASV